MEKRREIIEKKTRNSGINLTRVSNPRQVSTCRGFQTRVKFHLICLLWIGLNINVLAQKILKLDSGANPNAMIFKVGSEIVFQLAGEKNNWHQDRIEAIDIEKKRFAIATGMVAIADITAVRNLNPYPFWRSISYGLKAFSVSGCFWSGIGLIRGDTASKGFFIFSGGTWVTGWLIGILVRHKTYRLGKNQRSRLHVLDLTPA